MNLQEVQSCKCTPQVHIPFSTCWSDDNYIAMATDKGVNTVGGRWKARQVLTWAVVVLVCALHVSSASDITTQVFGGKISGIPAAFGDFNSDEYPDMFIIPNSTSIEILLGGDTEPFVRKSSGIKCSFKDEVTSIVPGDFDGDAIMDVMVTLSKGNDDGVCGDAELTEVRILWGSGDDLQCNATLGKTLLMCGQPLAMDWNQDMVIDLFGVYKSQRTFWVFNTSRTFPTIKQMTSTNYKLPKLRIPHSHAFLDLDGDLNPDMFVTTESGYEVWLKDPNEREGFKFNSSVNKFPSGVKTDGSTSHVGQSLFMDTELKGKLDHMVPICNDEFCRISSIYVLLGSRWVDLKINFHDKSNQYWGFVPPKKNSVIQNAITLHGGDYNMDGYPDLLVTLRNEQKNYEKTFFLKNEKCVADCNDYGRTFTIMWDELAPLNNNTSLGVFYDFGQDGILDVIFLNGNTMTAFRNNLDYDANFMKVMVITGIKEKKPRVIPTPTGSRKDRTYGTNLPGPVIYYNSTDQDDEPRASLSSQLPQSAYMCLHLPYTLFGLGRTANFVDKLTVGVNGKHHSWTQIIPNSQVVVIPIGDSDNWIAQLFVTPSKLIVKSFIALLGTCLLLALIIAVLWWKERREDHLERRQESHRFHYDAM